jgi:hypothetical protein
MHGSAPPPADKGHIAGALVVVLDVAVKSRNGKGVTDNV